MNEEAWREIASEVKGKSGYLQGLMHLFVYIKTPNERCGIQETRNLMHILDYMSFPIKLCP